MSRKLGVLAVASVAVIATACSSSHTSHPPTTAPKTATPTTAAPPDTVVPSSIPNEPKVRKYVTLAQCVPAAGGWHAGGTATNAGKSPVTYAITVSFVTKGATVIGVARTDVTVAAGKTKSWSVTKKLTAAKSTQCVLRGVATA